MLLVMPSVLKAKASKAAADAPAASGGWVKGVVTQLKDPFNASIILGILLSVIFQGNAMAKLGFAGSALKTLAAAQTPILFLLFSGIQSLQVQLLITLASQAATSVVGLGQIC